MTATVVPPARTVASWAAPSIPKASPDTTVAGGHEGRRRSGRVARPARSAAASRRPRPPVRADRAATAADEQHVGRHGDGGEPGRVGRLLDGDDADLERAKPDARSAPRPGGLGDARATAARDRRRPDGRSRQPASPSAAPARLGRASSRTPGGAVARQQGGEADRPEAVDRRQHGPRVALRRVGVPRPPRRSSAPAGTPDPEHQDASVASAERPAIRYHGRLLEMAPRRTASRRGRRSCGRPGAAAPCRGRWRARPRRVGDAPGASPPTAGTPDAARGRAADRSTGPGRASRARRAARDPARDGRRSSGLGAADERRGRHRGIDTHRSIRSRSGPETRRAYRSIDPAVQRQRSSGVEPGEAARARVHRRDQLEPAGKVMTRPARAMRMRPSSSGWRSASRTSRSNSASSSRNSTPWWAG